MMRLLLLFLVFSSSLIAEHITIDPSSRSFKMTPPKKERVDIFDFAEVFPELENIDVNAFKKRMSNFI